MSIKPEYWMKRALTLAQKGRIGTSPNPMVGACIVKNGRLIAEGYHARFGGPHAERIALAKAGNRARGATLYVTLEPCSTWGKTPPCLDEILQSGIKAVVIGAPDPNPAHNGAGIKQLRQKGIRVQTGVLSREVLRQNETFLKFMKSRLPYVTLKMAQSLDGKIASTTGKSRWITSPAARKYVHRLRAEQDAILIGKNTLLVDNPKLSPRMKFRNADPLKPWRVVIDPAFKLPWRARIMTGEQLTLFAVSDRHLKKIKTKGHGHILLPIPEKRGRLDLKNLLQYLASLGVAKLLVEGGGETAWSLLKEGLVDRVVWFVAPKIIGGRNTKTSVEGEGVSNLTRAIQLKAVRTRPIGTDWLLEAEVQRK